MREAVWKKIGDKEERAQVWVEDTMGENGEIVAGHFEEIIQTIPVYGVMYREVDEQRHEPPIQPPTTDDRLEALEQAILELAEVFANG